MCCNPWGCKESDMTEQLNNNSFEQPVPLSQTFFPPRGRPCTPLNSPFHSHPPPNFSLIQ